MGYWSDVERQGQRKTEEVYRGPILGGGHHAWALAEDKLLIKLRCAGIHTATMTDLFQRSQYAILSRTFVLKQARVIVKVAGTKWDWSAPDDWLERLGAFRDERRGAGTGKRWLPEEYDRLGDIFMSGCDTAESARRMGRTVLATRVALGRLRQEGEIPPALLLHDAELLERVKALFATGLSDAHIALKVGRSSQAIVNIRRKLGLKRNQWGAA